MSAPGFDCDVVVVGAGFAGLTAAAELQRSGLSVEVFEARDRVGGKTDSVIDATGRRVDVGGQFVCDDMPHVLGLVAASGASLVAVDHGRGGRGLVDATSPADVWSAFERGDAAYEQLWSLDPTSIDPALRLGDWLDRNAPDAPAARAARSSLDGVMCMSVDDIPVRHVIDLARRTPLTRDELQYVVDTTMHGVADWLAGTLRTPVHIATPVRGVDVDVGKVTITTDIGRCRARHVVLALPPTAVATIEVVPRLDADIVAALASFVPGEVSKFLIRYEHPFWLAPATSPTVAFVDPAGLYIGDASRRDDPTLVAFLGGPMSQAWHSIDDRERRARLMTHLVAAYGPVATHPVEVIERHWPPDPWGGGGYWNVLTDMSTNAIDVLRRGAPGITFCSTELAPSFPGYVEGAITAGRAGAAAALATLRRPGDRSATPTT
jgi:monoamine oxidase